MRLGNKDIREKSAPPSLGICPFDIFHIIEHTSSNDSILLMSRRPRVPEYMC